MKIKSILIVFGLVCSAIVFSQESEKVDSLDMLNQRVSTLEDAVQTVKKLKISGYFQPQWQSSQVDSLGNGPKDMKVGSAKNGAELNNYNRFGVRRGRLKATYEDFGCIGVAEFEMTEKSVTVKNLHVTALDPWVGVVALKGGIFDRPFGYEISYSSSRLESPERSRIVQTLFPDESDLGSMLIIQAPKTSPWYAFKLEAGLFAGNGIAQDNDSKKDFIGHLAYTKATSKAKFGLGASFYSGSIFQPTKFVYAVTNGVFAVDSTLTNKNGFAKRQYFGFDGQYSTSTVLGLSSIRAEYIFGKQPGSSSSTNSPNATTVVVADTYLRKFAGGYVHFIQDIADTKHSIVVKYDWYDPNTDIIGSNVGVPLNPTQKAAKNVATGKADMAYSTLGLGYLYRMNNNVRLSAYYDIITNESTKVKGYFSNVNDNLWTVRLQYKF